MQRVAHGHPTTRQSSSTPSKCGSRGQQDIQRIPNLKDYRLDKESTLARNLGHVILALTFQRPQEYCEEGEIRQEKDSKKHAKDYTQAHASIPDRPSSQCQYHYVRHHSKSAQALSVEFSKSHTLGERNSYNKQA